MTRRIDAILKRERALKLLSKQAERVIGGLYRQLGQLTRLQLEWQPIQMWILKYVLAF